MKKWDVMVSPGQLRVMLWCATKPPILNVISTINEQDDLITTVGASFTSVARVFHNQEAVALKDPQGLHSLLPHSLSISAAMSGEY